jgi:hypothetical protein
MLVLVLLHHEAHKKSKDYLVTIRKVKGTVARGARTEDVSSNDYNSVLTGGSKEQMDLEIEN